MFLSENWEEYQLIDAGDGEKLEKWGKYILRRPDPQAIWNKDSTNILWDNPDMIYHRSDKGGGYWENQGNAPQEWQIKFNNLTFLIRPTAFKHTGIFPEQAANWEWMISKVKSFQEKYNQNPQILNLFGYTGGATVALASAGAEVCHVDASKGMTNVAKENIKLSGLENIKTRFIVDDCKKFVEREIRRGKKYNGILMDPPVYGRGPDGQLWKLEEDLGPLVDLCLQLFDDKPARSQQETDNLPQAGGPLFFIINAYATEFSATALGNILKTKIKTGEVTSGELGLKIKDKDLILPCGLTARWQSNEE